MKKVVSFRQAPESLSERKVGERGINDLQNILAKKWFVTD